MEKSQLKNLKNLAKGLSGEVFVTSTQVLTHPGDLVYKEYNAHPDHDQWLADASRAIAWRAALPAADRRALDTFAAWPIEMVTDRGQPVGCLIPRIPQRFFIDQREPDGSTKRVPRSFEKMTGTPQQWATLGMDVEARTWTPELRLALGAHIVFSIKFLHKRGLVYGDLSLKNAVFDAQNPGIMLLDCDAAAPLTDLNRRQANSPSFLAPECTPPGTNPFSRGRSGFQDQATDVYKFGQLLAKALIPMGAQRKGIAHLKAHLSPSVYQAVSRTQSLDPTQRGTADDLYGAIYDEVSRLVHPPQVAGFTANLTTLPRGTDVEFTWKVMGATELRLDGPNGFTLNIPKHSTRWTMTPPVSGPYELFATNRFGTSTATCTLQVFDMPTIHLDLKGLNDALYPANLPQVTTPTIQIPNVEPVTTTLAAAIPSPPAVSTPTLDGLLSLTALTDTMTAITGIDVSANLSLDSHLPHPTDLLVDEVSADLVAQLDALADVVSQAQDRAERAAARAANEAGRRVAAQLFNQRLGQPPSGPTVPGSPGTP